MREDLVSENSVGDLGSVHEVHFKQPSLEVAMLGLVILQSIQEERSSLLDHVLGKENIDNAVKVNQGTRLFVGELSREFGTLLGVHANYVLKELGVVWLVSNLLRVGKDLVKLTGFRKTSDDFVGNICLEVNAESQVHVIGSDNVTQLLGAFQLVLTHPLLKQVFPVLL